MISDICPDDLKQFGFIWVHLKALTGARTRWDWFVLHVNRFLQQIEYVYWNQVHSRCLFVRAQNVSICGRTENTLTVGHPSVFARVALSELQFAGHEAVAGTAGHRAPDGLYMRATEKKHHQHLEFRAQLAPLCFSSHSPCSGGWRGRWRGAAAAAAGTTRPQRPTATHKKHSGSHYDMWWACPKRINHIKKSLRRLWFFGQIVF